MGLMAGFMPRLKASIGFLCGHENPVALTVDLVECCVVVCSQVSLRMANIPFLCFYVQYIHKFFRKGTSFLFRHIFKVQGRITVSCCGDGRCYCKVLIRNIRSNRWLTFRRTRYHPLALFALNVSKKRYRAAPRVLMIFDVRSFARIRMVPFGEIFEFDRTVTEHQPPAHHRTQTTNGKRFAEGRFLL